MFQIAQTIPMGIYVRKSAIVWMHQKSVLKTRGIVGCPGSATLGGQVLDATVVSVTVTL